MNLTDKADNQGTYAIRIAYCPTEAALHEEIDTTANRAMLASRWDTPGETAGNGTLQLWACIIPDGSLQVRARLGAYGECLRPEVYGYRNGRDHGRSFDITPQSRLPLLAGEPEKRSAILDELHRVATVLFSDRVGIPVHSARQVLERIQRRIREQRESQDRCDIGSPGASIGIGLAIALGYVRDELACLSGDRPEA